MAAAGRYQGLLLDGEAAPEQEYEVFADLREPLDDGVGELLPADACMAGCHVCAHGEGRIEEQHSLLCPAF